MSQCYDELTAGLPPAPPLYVIIYPANQTTFGWAHRWTMDGERPGHPANWEDVLVRVKHAIDCGVRPLRVKIVV